MVVYQAALRYLTISYSVSVRSRPSSPHPISRPLLTTLVSPLTGIRNQFTSLYRYGQARECSAKWEDFKFCLANRSLSEERKEEEWVKRRAEHWAERRVGPSSEDIWEAKKLD